MKKYVPYRAKVKFQLAKRWFRDLSHGRLFLWAKTRNQKTPLQHYLSVYQDLKTNDSNVEKVNNMRLASEKINEIVLFPGEIFSYWKAVGNPNKKNGFTESRSLINGELKPTIGGGLCQLSGVLYHLSLKANLEIIERHHHSVDIYTEETRYTPLGSDATVVYGYKDFQVRNNLNSPIQFFVDFKDEQIVGKLYSMTKIQESKVSFKIESKTQNKTVVTTEINGKPVEKSVYKLLINI